MKTRTATASDFKPGNFLYNKYGQWFILNQYDKGIFEARGKAGIKCIFPSEAQFYQVSIEG